MAKQTVSTLGCVLFVDQFEAAYVQKHNREGVGLERIGQGPVAGLKGRVVQAAGERVGKGNLLQILFVGSVEAKQG